MHWLAAEAFIGRCKTAYFLKYQFVKCDIYGKIRTINTKFFGVLSMLRTASDISALTPEQLRELVASLQKDVVSREKQVAALEQNVALLERR